MNNAKVKTQEKNDIVIEEEEEVGVFHRTIEKTGEKRKRDEEFHSNKYNRTQDGHRSPSKTTNSRDFLSVPFWKQLNNNRISSGFHPNEIGTFSLLKRDNEKECFEDNRYLRVFKYPLETLNVNFDLKIGESDFVSESQDKNIDAMLWWTVKHKDKIFKNNQFTFDFLLWRGVLRLIMFSIYEKHSDWLIGVIKYKNAYFLCEFVTDKQIQEEQNMTAEHRAFCYYGHKFEEYVTKNKISSEISSPSKQFTGVFQSTIGSHRLLYGAEMDCIVEKSSSKTEHIELKVSAGNSLNDLQFQYNRKFAKWWIQCFLVGIQTMVIGFRDNNGIVHKISPLNIAEIERTTNTWTRQSFMNFFTLFADFLKEHVIDEYSLEKKEIILFYFSPSSQKITVQKSSDSKYHFIPDRFFKEFD